jgi:hypothetical protein
MFVPWRDGCLSNPKICKEWNESCLWDGVEKDKLSCYEVKFPRSERKQMTSPQQKPLENLEGTIAK